MEYAFRKGGFVEVASGIHRIEAPFGDRVVCTYLFVGEERALLVDTGIDAHPREYLLPYLETHAIPPEKIHYVLISHADMDHMGGNAAARDLLPRALFTCHELDRPLIESIDRMIAERYGEFAADHGIADGEELKEWYRANAHGVPTALTLTGGETIRLGPGWDVAVLHTPGHSRGHVSVHDPRSHAVVIADAALWNAVLKRDGAPAFPPTYRYVDTYLASIQRLQGMPIETLLTSHYPVYRGPLVAEFLGESRAFVDRVEAALRDELRQSAVPPTTRELIAALSPRLGTWPASAAPSLAFPLMGHLERLHQFGLVTTSRRDGYLSWRWQG
jgi:glyoxylase-like metal-dependent hydrolase (beta-lactamase superfamily II)